MQWARGEGLPKSSSLPPANSENSNQSQRPERLPHGTGARARGEGAHLHRQVLQVVDALEALGGEILDAVRTPQSRQKTAGRTRDVKPCPPLGVGCVAWLCGHWPPHWPRRHRRARPGHSLPGTPGFWGPPASVGRPLSTFCLPLSLLQIIEPPRHRDSPVTHGDAPGCGQSTRSHGEAEASGLVCQRQDLAATTYLTRLGSAW